MGERSRSWPRAAAFGWLTLISVGCRDLVGSATLPANTQSPNTYNTPEGAMRMYYGVQQALQSGMSEFIIDAGLMSDELAAAHRGTSPLSIGAQGDPIDERNMPEQLLGNVAGGSYSGLQALRGTSREALGLLATYAPNASPALQGEVYAVNAYAELMLADLYCSGVPLSTLDFQQDFTYAPSSSRVDVTHHALALFDSALALSHDSVSITRLAAVGKGRALLDLGEYDSAAQAVASVPTTFQYQVGVDYGSVLYINESTGMVLYTVLDREGGTGLPFVSSNDPRVPMAEVGTNAFGLPLNAPVWVLPLGPTPVSLASGIEARLIEAEAALHDAPGDLEWLTILNTLRTTCTTATSCPMPVPPGTGGVEGLPPLSDPGTDTGRVSLLFAERAYWLFLTGHRQGDLRRLVRATSDGGYGRSQGAVFPSGPYFGGSGAYGTDVTLPIPSTERVNPQFHGCFDRRA